MTDRDTLLKQIYVPTALGAGELLPSVSDGPTFDPDSDIGVRFAGGQYYPIMAEETVTTMIPVSAYIMRDVVADKLICPWRLERDGFSSNFGWHRKRATVSNTMVRVADVQMKGTRTYTDLITLVRLAEG